MHAKLVAYKMNKCSWLLPVALFALTCLQAVAVHAQTPVNFSSGALKGIALVNPTSLQFGPDGRLYVAQQNGLIKIFRIVRNGPNDYTATATETIDLINKMPNHNDDGSVNTAVITRQVTGILVKGTAAKPLIYVSSSDSRIGGPSGDLNLDTNSGILSVLTWTGTAWIKVDLIRGLPRSEENHATNGIQIDDQTNTLLLAVGGFTNAGSPSNNFAFITEYALAAAILSIDLTVINAMTTKGSGNTAYKYDLPTLDDPTRTNNPDGTDVGDPFGGNDGLNQAKLVPDGPVKIFSPGYRNAYDLVLTKTPGKARRVYTVDNGANQSWGGFPDGEGTPGVTNKYVIGEPGSTGPGINEPQVNDLDNLHFVGDLASYQAGSFYGGHPHPVRANPAGAGLYTRTGTTGVWRNSKTGDNPLPQDWPPVSVANPVESDFRAPGNADGALLTFTASTNGIAEYTASNFNSTMKGSLLVACFDGKIFRVNPNASGADVTNARSATNRLIQDAPFAANFGAQPLDITTQGDNDVYPGTVWVATYGADAIIIFEPQDFIKCSGLYNTNDDDKDGYTNADEADNGTDACSAASMPADNDQDLISDRNDPDDDNDGMSDKTDRFALDAKNGLETLRPLSYDLFNNDPGTGLFGLGFTGLMTNSDSDYLHLFEPDNLIAGGAVGAFSVIDVDQGDALGTANKQKNGFQFGFRADAAAGPYTLNARLLAPFFNSQVPANFQSLGLYLGTGDQDNYLKITLNANDGAGGIEVVSENAGIATATQYALPGGVPATSIEFYLSVDPIAGTVQPGFSINNSTAIQNLGTPVTLAGALRTLIMGNTGAVAAGVLSTSRGTTPFTATWDYIRIAVNTATATGTWQTVAPVGAAPLAREENAFIEAGNRFYLLGGRSIQAVQAYDPLAKAWTNKAAPPIELHHFQAVVMDGLIYIVGAFTGGYPHETPVANVYIYNPVTDKWITGPVIPQARRRGAAGAVIFNKKIYLISGIKDGHYSGWVPWFDEYDPATGIWRILPDAPRPRDHFHAVVADSKIYVAGGRRSSGITGEVFSLTVPEVDVFNFNTNQWLTLPAGSNLPTQRAGAATTMLGNELLVIGGESAQPAAHGETEALDITTNTWRTLASLQQARHGTQVVNTNNGLYIVAGAGTKGGSMKLSSFESFYFYGSTTPHTPALTASTVTATPSLKFGTQRIGDSTTQLIRLANRNGNQATVLSATTQAGSGFFRVSLPYTFPVAVPPNGNLDIPVNFKPTQNGSFLGQLTIPHNTTGSNTVTSFSGTGATPIVMINAGGPKLATSMGTFSADTLFAPVPGNKYASTKAIAGTSDDALYQTERTAGANNGSFSYAIPLKNGTYQVKLHFAEIYFTTIRSRIFDVSIEGLKVLDNYDIVAKVGAAAAKTEIFETAVADGILNISFSAATADGGINKPKVSAIEVIPVTQAVNQAPVADAGPDKQVTLPATTTMLTGSGLDPDGTIAAYTWTQVSGPNQATFSSKTVAAPALSGMIEGIYTFNLVVTDNLGLNSGAAQVNVIVSPVNTEYRRVVYRINSGGPQVTNSIGTFRSDTLFSPVPGYKFSSTKSIAGTLDDAMYQDERSATTNNGTFTYQVPVANGSYKIVLHFTELYFTAAGSRKFDVSIEGKKVLDNYDIVAKTGAATAVQEAFFTNVTDGVLTLLFSATTADGGVNRPEIAALEILAPELVNKIPVANAGPDKAIRLPENSVVLNGAGTDTDGSIAKYQWTQVLGPNAATINSSESAEPTISGLAEGTYVFQLVVTDNAGAASNPDQVTVEVAGANALPLAEAGPDKTITLPANSVALDGAGTDTDGSISNYQWSQADGPATAVFSSVIIAKPTVSGLQPGTYRFALVVTDNNDGTSTPDTVTVTVLHAPNKKPVANAGADQVIELTASEVTLSGSGIDDDGQVASYRWNLVSGAGVTINDAAAATTTAGNLSAGTYVFSLVVVDNDGLESDPDEVTITVGDAPNQAPLANAGTDQAITLPLNKVTLEGSGSDADGNIQSYEWTLATGPAGSSPVIDTPNGAVTTVSNLTEGRYTFRLVVTDDQGARSEPSTVGVTVVAAANPAPTANAGPDKTITLPTNSVELNGSGSDPNDGIAGFHWQQVSGPNTATISNPEMATITVSGLVEGTYVFRLEVTNNANEPSDGDLVTVTVHPLPANSIISFTLINADNEQPIMNLTNGQVLNLAVLPTRNLNISINTNPVKVGSVSIALAGPQTRNIIENVGPYSVFGDVSGNFNAWIPATGNFTLTATPFTASKATGTQGTPVTIAFSVINSQPLTMIQSKTGVHIQIEQQLVPYPVPTKDGTIMITNGQNLKGKVSYVLVNATGSTMAKGYQVVQANTSLLRFEFGKRMAAGGIYFLHLESQGKKYVLRLIKQR